MVGIENFITFLISTLFFAMTPGMDTVFVLNKSIVQGKKSGVYASLGICTGVLVHTIFAALGFSVLIAKSTIAFSFIKYAGVAYLVYLGVMAIKNSSDIVSFDTQSLNQSKSKNDYWSGLVTNTLNPKVALFFLAFFPQFINPAHIENPIPFLFLGIAYALISIVWLLILVSFTSMFSLKITSNLKANIWFNKVGGLVFIAMGVLIALN
ncbi:MAG: LysE family translocator [Balneolaceae bacterium]